MLAGVASRAFEREVQDLPRKIAGAGRCEQQRAFRLSWCTERTLATAMAKRPESPGCVVSPSSGHVSVGVVMLMVYVADAMPSSGVTHSLKRD
jgi:hypothetical protein